MEQQKYFIEEEFDGCLVKITCFINPENTLYREGWYKNFFIDNFPQTYSGYPNIRTYLVCLAYELLE